MKITTKYGLIKPLDEHIDLVDSIAYKIAGQEMKIQRDIIDEYYLLYLKKKPKHIPKFLYDYLIKKIVVMANFR